MCVSVYVCVLVSVSVCVCLSIFVWAFVSLLDVRCAFLLVFVSLCIYV